MKNDREEYYYNTIISNLSQSYGVLVDIGASGFDNATSLMIQKGYGGILIEANPYEAKKLEEYFKGREDITVINKAISNKEGIMDFLCHENPGWSSLEKNVFYKEGAKVETIKIEVIKIHKLLKSLNVPEDFDLLKVDAEGFDYRILESMFNESKYRPQMIMHEIQHPGPEEFIKLLEKNGYTIISGLPHYGNIIYKKEE
jgi:FkbM family methyltransferase